MSLISINRIIPCYLKGGLQEAQEEVQAREEVRLPDGRELPSSERVLQRPEVGLVRLRRYRPLCSSQIDAIFEHD